jgi:hypothetical protein
VDDVFARSPLAGIAWIVTNTDGHAVERLFRGVPGTLVFRRRQAWYRRRLVWVGAVFSAFAILGALVDDSNPPRREVAATAPAAIAAAAGEAISFVPSLAVADGDGIVAEHWSFGDDSIARRERAGVAKTRITHVYDSPGRYAARVVVTTRAGERRGAYFAVTVSGPRA